jgi:pimeloyl-ACP methyl ester carboxylesterase
MGTCPGFEATMAATSRRCYRSGASVGVPVTVAFGSRDLLPRRRSRRVDQLPPGARVAAALPGRGHVPMADDPAAVAAFVTTGAARASRRA